MENRIKHLIISSSILIGLSGCYKEETVSIKDVFLAVKNDTSYLPADGISKVTIAVELPTETTDADNSIVFSTTKGLFDIAAKNTITVSAQNIQDANGSWHKIATATLVSSTEEGQAIVAISAKNYTQYDTISFVRSYPDQIRVLTDKLNYLVGSGTEVTVTVQTKKNPGAGAPSGNQAITLDAFDLNGNQIGLFRNKYLITDANGSCVNYFSLAIHDTLYRGTIEFKAAIPSNANGDTINSTSLINVVK